MTAAVRIFSTLSLLVLLAGCAFYGDNQSDNRTANRSTTGEIFYPERIFNKPEFYEFTPAVSNHDAQNQHPQQWDGQDWDPAAWNEKWTPKIALNKFFKNHTFHKQYMDGKTPVMEVGPTFYKLSDLDQRRSLKLLADETKVFEKNGVIVLRDWRTHDIVGFYNRQGGMKLN